MSSIDLNCISKAAFNSIFEAEKNRMSFSQLNESKISTLYSIIDNAGVMLKYADIKEKEIVVQILKDALALCYICNINLNDFVSANLKDEDNQANNPRAAEQAN